MILISSILFLHKADNIRYQKGQDWARDIRLHYSVTIQRRDRADSHRRIGPSERNTRTHTQPRAHTHTRSHEHTHASRTPHTHTRARARTPHTRTHCFCEKWGLSIGVMVVILCNCMCYCPTPKLSPHRRRCIFTFPQNSLCMI